MIKFRRTELLQDSFKASRKGNWHNTAMIGQPPPPPPVILRTRNVSVMFAEVNTAENVSHCNNRIRSCYVIISFQNLLCVPYTRIAFIVKVQTSRSDKTLVTYWGIYNSLSTLQGDIYSPMFQSFLLHWHTFLGSTMSKYAVCNLQVLFAAWNSKLDLHTEICICNKSGITIW